MTSTIIIKSDSAKNWQKFNPVLKECEFGFDTTNKIVKIGDGQTKWNRLKAFLEVSL